VEWVASTGARHLFNVHAADEDLHVPAPRPEGRGDREPDDFEPLTGAAPSSATVSARARSVEGGAGPSWVGRPDESDRLVGRVVHRLLQRYGFDGASDDALRGDVLRLLRRDAAAVEYSSRTTGDLVAAAVTTYRRMCGRAEVRELYAAGEALREVPFTMRLEDTVVRGTIDCLIRAADRITILEFKTGRPHESHRAQLALYRQAAERLFPGTPVEGVLVYPDVRRP
jgi:hypothetical protein